MKNSTNPFQIGFHKNEQMGCYDLVLQIGGLKDEEQAKKLADLLSDWLIDDASGWKARVQ